MKNEYNFNVDTALKQGFSEQLVEWAFKEVGYRVFKFGYESILAGINGCNIHPKWGAANIVGLS